MGLNQELIIWRRAKKECIPFHQSRWTFKQEIRWINWQEKVLDKEIQASADYKPWGMNLNKAKLMRILLLLLSKKRVKLKMGESFIGIWRLNRRLMTIVKTICRNSRLFLLKKVQLRPDKSEVFFKTLLTSVVCLSDFVWFFLLNSSSSIHSIIKVYQSSD